MPTQLPSTDYNEAPDPEDNYATAIESKLDKHSLFYCAEVDCCMKGEHKELSDYCELKTSRCENVEDLGVEILMEIFFLNQR